MCNSKLMAKNLMETFLLVNKLKRKVSNNPGIAFKSEFEQLVDCPLEDTIWCQPMSESIVCESHKSCTCTLVGVLSNMLSLDLL